MITMLVKLCRWWQNVPCEYIVCDTVILLTFLAHWAVHFTVILLIHFLWHTILQAATESTASSTSESLSICIGQGKGWWILTAAHEGLFHSPYVWAALVTWLHNGHLVCAKQVTQWAVRLTERVKNVLFWKRCDKYFHIIFYKYKHVFMSWK